MLLAKRIHPCAPFGKPRPVSDFITRLGVNISGIILKIVQTLVLKGITLCNYLQFRLAFRHALANFDQLIGEIVDQLLVSAHHVEYGPKIGFELCA